MIDLAGTWRLTCANRNIEVDYAVPGDVHSALIKAGVIPDPYVGKNELLCRWVADEEWVATREFTLSAVEEGRYYLDVDYLDTVATVCVNGVEMLKAENCFRRYNPDVTKALKVGVNVVEVTLHSNTKAANEKQAAQPFYIPYSVSNNPIPNGNMLRKPQCHFGWDWNLAMVPFGICGAFAIKQKNSQRIRELTVSQSEQSDGSFEVVVTVNLFSPFDGDAAQCLFSLNGVEKVVAEPNPYRTFICSESFLISSPKLWWPVGQGEQHLYDLEVRCGDQVERRKIGLRKLELITDKDKVGSRFAFKVNDREVFCKGANWIPADALPSNATPELTRKLLQAAKDANMNMVRVWGGGYYEKDFFYEICDELGLLVWQDFMFSCSLYPSTEEFLDEVRAEAIYQVERLQHHACIAVWCGDNELLGALTWFEESRKNRDRYLVNYDRLNRTLEETVKNTDATAIWWPSSPSPGILDFGDTWHDDSKGDMHFWSVWHEGRDFEHYYDVKPRFCSEFGFQSFPSLRLIKVFAESEEDLNISSAVMEHHQRNKGGNARIAETMFRNFRFPMDFGNFVYLSQVQHGLAMKMAVEYWRSLKPHCMGTLYWQLNDTWPVASWSGLDHEGSWKLMHYMAREFYAPVLVTARKHETDFIISAVSDLPHEFALSFEVFAVTMSGKKKSVYKANTKIGADGVELARLPLAGFAEGEILLLQWTDEKGHKKRSHASPMPYKHLPLVNPGLVHKVNSKDGAVSITLHSKALALYVALECDVAGHFSNNSFDLLAEESVMITFTPDNLSDLTRAAGTLVVRDLYSSSHVTY
jgi:beta-mannosidase